MGGGGFKSNQIGKGSNDFDKVTINQPNMQIYHNSIGEDSELVNKLKGGGAKKLGINELNKIREEIHNKQ